MKRTVLHLTTMTYYAITYYRMNHFSCSVLGGLSFYNLIVMQSCARGCATPTFELGFASPEHSDIYP